MFDFLKDDSKREQFLFTLFPAALILAVYAVMFALPMRNTQSAVQTEYATESAIAISTEMAAASKINLETEKQSLERINKRVASSKQQIRELSQGWRSRKSRLETLEKITELMQDYNLSIVSQGGESGEAVSSCLLYTSPSPRDRQKSRMPSSA